MAKAKLSAEEKKENECAICLDPMDSKKIVLLCAHAYCVVCLIQWIKSKQQMRVECPQCRKVATYFMIMDEGPDGPTDAQKAFIRRYNTRVYEMQGFITILENLPFIMHRYWQDVVASCGLCLFE